MKITIIGYSGSGKTTLAKRISNEFNIPHQQIDRIWFKADGHLAKSEAEKTLSRNLIKGEISKFVEHEQWVSDGFYSKIQTILADRADYVVVMELPLWRRLYNHWKRVLLKIDRHPEVTWLQDLLHSCMIIKRTFTYPARLRFYKETYKDKLVIIKNYRQADNFFASLEK